MNVVLDDERGRVAKVRIMYDRVIPERAREWTKDAVPKDVFKWRSTHVNVLVYDYKGLIGCLSGNSFCSPEDNFEKREGRKIAMRRVFAENRGNRLLSKEECHKIAEVILSGHVAKKEEDEQEAETL